ncbi:MAG TPA: hypothetical protein VKB80_03170 [Kofleriaceae bacterium]|nr:hypothetical protein [Kofleriaceae bacterium]
MAMNNPYPPGSDLWNTWNSANPQPGQSSAPTPQASGGGTTQTPNGPKTLEEMTNELRAAGYGGPWDEASVVATYNRTASGGGGAGGGGGGGGGTVGGLPASLFNPAAAAAADAAVRAVLGQRALDLEQARDIWKKAYDTANLSGYLPGSGVAGHGQAAMDALDRLRGDARYQAADGETKRQMEAATWAQTLGIDTASARQAIDRLRALTATTGQPSTAALVEQVLAQTPGGAGIPTLAREQEQNRATIDTLRLLSGLRGPENAFAYAATLQNLPASMRQNIAAAMGRLPFGAMNPAQAGLLGDVGVGAGTQMQQYALPAGYGARTAQQALPMPATTQPSAIGATPGATMQQALLPAQAAALRAGMATPQPALVSGYYSDAGRGQLQPGMVYGQVITPAGQVDRAQPYSTTYGPRTTPAEQAGLQRPNQWSPSEFNRTGDYGRKLMLSGYQWIGEDPQEVMDQYAKSLPRAVGPRSGQYRAA